MHLIHLMMILHLNGLHQRSPFCNRLLGVMVVGVVGIDVLFHAIAVVVVHHYRHRLNLHDGRAFFARFSHRYRLLLVGFNAVWHLVVVYVAELILLRGDVRFNPSSVGAIQCIHMVEAWVVLHFIRQYSSVGRVGVELDEIIHAVWVWVDHLVVGG